MQNYPSKDYVTYTLINRKYLFPHHRVLANFLIFANLTAKICFLIAIMSFLLIISNVEHFFIWLKVLSFELSNHIFCGDAREEIILTKFYSNYFLKREPINILNLRTYKSPNQAYTMTFKVASKHLRHSLKENRICYTLKKKLYMSTV